MKATGSAACGGLSNGTKTKRTYYNKTDRRVGHPRGKDLTIVAAEMRANYEGLLNTLLTLCGARRFRSSLDVFK
jgi:hypothetical protein